MDERQGHAPWVRASHWIGAASLLVLAVTGFLILMVHPRLYWGEVGNDLTPALIELPISRNHQHGGWDTPKPFFARAGAPVSASRTFDIFNQNGWGRSLHFLAAWCLVVPGVALPARRPRRRPLPVARVAGRERAGAVGDRATRPRSSALADSRGDGRAPLQRAAEARLHVGDLRRRAADGPDRPGDVAGRRRRLARAAAPVRRLPVGADDPLLRRSWCWSCSWWCTW